MKFHPLCEQFPVMSDQELVELGEDIQKNGQLEPGLTLDGMILDGRNRYLACQIVGVEFQAIPYRGNNPAELVKSLNVHRRHLTESQRAILVAQVCNLQAGVHKSNTPRGVAQAEAAKEAKVSVRSVSRAVEVIKKGSEKLQNAVKSGSVAVKTAAKLTRLPKKKQDAVILKGPKEARKLAAGIAKPRNKMPCSAYTVLPKSAPVVAENPVTANGDSIAIVRACYEKHKAQWNAIPPAPPMLVIEAVCKALACLNR